ncbi:hypothetical protein GUJ93_ZPchr0008g12719 [Zizania palustris]|uniref:Uncharacterized protein n=1 Tax=Zizania palustris TaxID=103762 RepID=A0A8J5RF61_ZIZPA|nr:hypothetical protein GUJ93_ZPchr0008g12719 [Zizania palustris]
MTILSGKQTHGSTLLLGCSGGGASTGCLLRSNSGPIRALSVRARRSSGTTLVVHAAAVEDAVELQAYVSSRCFFDVDL